MQKTVFTDQVRLVAAALLILLSGPPSAHAMFYVNANGLEGPHSVVSFDEHVYPSGTALVSEYADLGIAFSPFAYYSPYGDSNISNFMPYGYAYPFSINFLSPKDRVAFRMNSNPVTTNFYAYLGADLVDTGAVLTNDSFIELSGVVFDRIVIQTSYAGGVKNASGTGPLIIDDLQFPTSLSIPEPGTLALLGLAIGCLAAIRCRELG